jgi:hypothetical protein
MLVYASHHTECQVLAQRPPGNLPKHYPALLTRHPVNANSPAKPDQQVPSRQRAPYVRVSWKMTRFMVFTMNMAIAKLP